MQIVEWVDEFLRTVVVHHVLIWPCRREVGKPLFQRLQSIYGVDPNRRIIWSFFEDIVRPAHWTPSHLG